MALISVCKLYALPAGSNPEQGKTYYIYNVEKQMFLYADNDGIAMLGSGGTPVTLSVADATAGTFFMTLSNGNKLAASLFNNVKTDGTGKYDQWGFERVAGSTDGRYYISCRMKEANAFGYLVWSQLTERLMTFFAKPADILYNGQWIFVSESDYENKVVVLDEVSETYTAPAAGGAATVHLKRAMTLNSWNTFSVPFDISGTQLKQAFGDDVRVAEFTGCDETTLYFTSVTGVEAGKPYLIRPVKDYLPAGYYVFEGVTRFVDEPENVTQGTVTYMPSFVQTTAPKGAYVLRKNEVYHLQSDMTMKGFRAYFVESGTDAKISFWTLDEGTTAIDGITESNADGGAVYSVSGQKVRNAGSGTNGLAKGIYIVNGKKVVR